MRFWISQRAVAVFWVLGGSSAVAHHSVTGVFDAEDEITISGVISKVEWINPHIHFTLEVTADNGEVEAWEWETAPTAFLQNAGITQDMLMGDGEPVTIHGIRARDKSLARAWVYRITYADGHFYQISNPR